MILTVVRNLYKQTQGPLVRSSADEPAVASQPLTCRVGVEDSAAPKCCLPVLGVQGADLTTTTPHLLKNHFDVTIKCLFDFRYPGLPHLIRGHGVL